MSVDLSDYIVALQTEVSAPGVDDFPDGTDDDFLNTLMNAFWSARLDGLLEAFTCDENGIITPINVQTPPLPDIGRDMIQLVILYGSFAILRNVLRGLRTMFSATAGPVKFEYQQSANLLTEIIKEMIERRNVILTRLSDLGSAPVFVIDAIMARDNSLRYGDITWVSYGSNYLPDWGLHH